MAMSANEFPITAKKGYECRHNIGYWTGVEYLGLGLGASSYTYGYRYHNTENLQEYLSLNLYEGGAAAVTLKSFPWKIKWKNSCLWACA